MAVTSRCPDAERPDDVDGVTDEATGDDTADVIGVDEEIVELDGPVDDPGRREADDGGLHDPGGLDTDGIRRCGVDSVARSRRDAEPHPAVPPGADVGKPEPK